MLRAKRGLIAHQVHCETRYAATSWTVTRRVIARIEVSIQGMVPASDPADGAPETRGIHQAADPPGQDRCARDRNRSPNQHRLGFRLPGPGHDCAVRQLSCGNGEPGQEKFRNPKVPDV